MGLSRGRNGNETQNSQRVRKGSFSRTGLEHMLEAVAGREEAVAGRSTLSAEGVHFKARVTRPCPCPYSPGPLAISASCCLPWQPARSRDLTASCLHCPLGPEAQGPGGKKDVADQKVQRRKEAGAEEGNRGGPGLATFLFLASVAAPIKQD